MLVALGSRIDTPDVHVVCDTPCCLPPPLTLNRSIRIPQRLNYCIVIRYTRAHIPGHIRAEQRVVDVLCCSSRDLPILEVCSQQVWLWEVYQVQAAGRAGRVG